MPQTSRPSDLTQTLAEFASAFGLSRAAGLCLGAIWRNAQPPSAEDLCVLLSLSRSNVSVALKELRQAGLVQVARAPGTRRDFFVADPNPWALMRAALAEHHRRNRAEPVDQRRDFFVADPNPWALMRAALAEHHRREIAPLIDRLGAIAAQGADPRAAEMAEMAATAGQWFTKLMRRDGAELAALMGGDKAEKKQKNANKKKQLSGN